MTPAIGWPDAIRQHSDSPASSSSCLESDHVPLPPLSRSLLSLRLLPPFNISSLLLNSSFHHCPFSLTDFWCVRVPGAHVVDELTPRAVDILQFCPS